MEPILGAAQLAALTLLLFVGVASAAGRYAVPRLIRTTTALPPQVANGRLRVLAAMPLLVGVGLSALAFAPSVAAWALGIEHHCETHLGHPHLCVVHLPSEGGTVLGWSIVLIVAAALVARARPMLGEWLRARSVVAHLMDSSSPGERPGVRRLETPDPLCAAVGWIRPSVVTSDGFRAAMTDTALEAALAHELEHARRRDSLWRAVAQATTMLLPERVRRDLLSALDLSAERACDEAAAVTVGDRLVVADAILQAQRLGRLLAHPAPSAGCATFVPAQWETRVRSLLDAPPQLPSRWQRWDVLAVAPVLVALALSSPLHHAAESLLALLLH